MPRDLSFDQALQHAREHERAVGAWMVSRGWAILPIYEGIVGEDKGPRLLAATGSLVVPDLLVSRGGFTCWVEVKWKARADFTRVTQRPETGIDGRLWLHYLEVQRITGIPVYLLFIQDAERVVVAGSVSELAPLARTSPRFGRHGGLFFGLDDLAHVCSLDDLRGVA